MLTVFRASFLLLTAHYTKLYGEASTTKKIYATMIWRVMKVKLKVQWRKLNLIKIDEIYINLYRFMTCKMCALQINIELSVIVVCIHVNQLWTVPPSILPGKNWNSKVNSSAEVSHVWCKNTNCCYKLRMTTIITAKYY